MAERTCITTGNILPTHRLIRFVVSPDGYAIADLAGRLPGRGAWVTATEAAVRMAEKQGYFKRAIGSGVRSEDQIISMITDQLRIRALSVAGLARRAGLLLGGSGKLLAERQFVGLLAANDASPREFKRLKLKLKVDWTARSFSSKELGKICGRESLVFVGVRSSAGQGNGNLSDVLKREIRRLDRFCGALGCNDVPDGCIT